MIKKWRGGENNKKQRPRFPPNYCKANSVSIAVFANLSCLGTCSIHNEKGTDEELDYLRKTANISKDRCQVDPSPVFHLKYIYISMKTYYKSAFYFYFFEDFFYYSFETQR